MKAKQQAEIKRVMLQNVGYANAWAILRADLGLPKSTESGQDVLDKIKQLTAALAECRQERDQWIVACRAAAEGKTP